MTLKFVLLLQIEFLFLFLLNIISLANKMEKFITIFKTRNGSRY